MDAWVAAVICCNISVLLGVVYKQGNQFFCICIIKQNGERLKKMILHAHGM
jgi:hypothetical protein